MDEPQLEYITDSDDDSNDSQPDVDFQGDCLKSCELPFKDRRETALRRKLRLKRLRRNLLRAQVAGTLARARLREAREQLSELEQRSRNRDRTRKVQTTWKTKLAMMLRGNEESLSYANLYKLSCREENSSTLLHPMLRLRAPNTNELAAELAAQRESLAGEARDEPVSVQVHFERPFPQDILIKILKYALVFPGEPVHVVSRLDEHQFPDETHVLARPNDELDPEGTHLRLLRRFLVGEGPFSLTYAQKPNELLAPLLVSRQWHYIATNLFYGLNRFCFSSLGELGRFARGIGPRLQRVQDIELFWIGSFEVLFKINRSGRFVSRRSQPLSWLPEARRLKRVGVYLRASDPAHMRRRHEILGKVRFDKNHTINQANFRQQRNMYTVQGMDNMWCLRGTHAVKFWDYDEFLNGGAANRCIRDHDFIAQMNDVTGRPKAPADERMARFRHLCALSAAYVPSEAEVCAVEYAVHMEPERDDGRVDVHEEPNDSGHGSDQDSPGDSSDDSDGPPPGGPPVIVVDDDDDDDDEGVAMSDAPLNAEQDGAEMTYGGRQGHGAAMAGTSPDGAGGGSPLADGRLWSPSLFFGPLSPRRLSTMPPYTASAGSVDPESSLFFRGSSTITVKDDDDSNNDDNGEGNDAGAAPVVQGRRPVQDWEMDDDEEGSEESDDDDDKDEKK
ncbi:hypothetical protein ISF_02499 [Cordyceps fumosorosea ARSEF 2679]|uniref:Uncharacterized protein n=1 Tax=Cordyceps fumosorosea (strain ARSEF 2679) TaxID=1081104 RepID=A0A168BTC9_CORFA|nr:hypothetical protein ISF_02499 [Cordyceps fumosorosea ARSEF 2679]OAA70525.1 hypothetical protein ISF_02499 [Cordyceps fumosorosea ARSEF 2679]